MSYASEWKAAIERTERFNLRVPPQQQTTGLLLDEKRYSEFPYVVHELLLKRLLGWCIDIIELNAKLTPSTEYQGPAPGQNILGSHDLRRLLNALKQAASLAGEPPPPDSLTDLVDSLVDVEKDDHWSRYDHSRCKGKNDFHHKAEATIPIVDLQELLEQVVGSVVSRAMGDETYETELYHTWSGLNCAMEDLMENRT